MRYFDTDRQTTTFTGFGGFAPDAPFTCAFRRLLDEDGYMGVGVRRPICDPLRIADRALACAPLTNAVDLAAFAKAHAALAAAGVHRDVATPLALLRMLPIEDREFLAREYLFARPVWELGAPTEEVWENARGRVRSRTYPVLVDGAKVADVSTSAYVWEMLPDVSDFAVQAKILGL